MDYTGRLDDNVEAEGSMVGQKAANLLKLASAGYPVPPGFYISSEAYRRLMTQTGLYQVAADLIANAAGQVSARLAAPALEIRALIEQQPLPVQIAGSIVDAYAELGRRSNCHVLERTPVAIRSSPLTPTYAGHLQCPLLDTYLNCRGSNSLLQLTRRCWSSLWSDRALEYRRRAGIEHQEMSVAVIVQLMVNPRAAGSLRTTAQEKMGIDHCCITAAWGLGPADDLGSEGQDVVFVNKQNGRLLSYKTGTKRRRRVLSRHWGTITECVPDEMASRRILNPDQAAYLAALGSRIERFFGAPCELTWAQEAGHFYILSARTPDRERPSGAQTRTDSHKEDKSQRKTAATLQL